jgi:hypothetical protein
VERNPERSVETDHTARACLSALADLFAGRITAGETTARIAALNTNLP